MVSRSLDKLFRSVKTVTDLKNITKTKTPLLWTVWRQTQKAGPDKKGLLKYDNTRSRYHRNF